jgi:tetratricopeptide (TPR) repeat protein
VIRRVAAVVLLVGLAACAAPRPDGSAPPEAPAPPAPAASDLARWQAEASQAVAGGDFARADSVLALADAARPDHPRTLFVRAEAAVARGNAEAALDYYRRAYRGEDSEAHRDALTAALLADAQARFKAKDLAGAAARIEEAGTVNPKTPLDRYRGWIAYAAAERSEGEERARHLADAEARFRQALEREPENLDALLDLGSVLLAEQQYPEAVALYRGALADHPEDGGLFLALARAHGFTGENAAATAEEAAGRALRGGEAVADADAWARNGAARFPQSELERTLSASGPPETIRTYTVPGGHLVEVWFYRKRGHVDVFRDGVRVGERIQFGP